MKRLLALAALMSFAAPAAAQSVDVGKANWESLPALEQKHRDLPYAALVGRVEQMLQDRQCSLDGQHSKNFDIEVPYAVQLMPDGKVSRVLVADIGCAPLESLVGQIAIERGSLGDYADANAQSDRWYASRLNFTLQ